MRLLGVLAAIVLLGAAPAFAAAIQPKALVLHKADVPKGYSLSNTQVLGNPGPGAKPSFRQLAKRTGRITGYYADFTKGSDEITSVAELFRRPAGALAYLAWYENQLKTQGEGSRSRVALGDRGWIYRVHSTPNSTFVLWRDGRVVSSLMCHTSRGHRELAVALAHKQDRRATAAMELPPTR
jgi:hypothetical protein